MADWLGSAALKTRGNGLVLRVREN